MSTLVQQPSVALHEDNSNSSSSINMDKVVQSVENATKRLSQISTNTNSSNKKRKAQNKIGPWKLGRTLGRGSTGRVRLAKNVNTGKLAAVKIVPKSNFKKLENPKYKRNSQNSQDGLPYGIEREIIIMKLIAHPNIMGLYDVWENKNDLYLILEYIEGGELFDYLIKKGKLQEYEAVNYFKQIIDGISYLHQFNICHRDLKPENLLMDFNKNIKIADFGMAALEVREKMLETSCGSPHYASPEIVAGKNYHGAPSDVWSCGIILFALLTGYLPFDDENIRRLLLKVQNGKFIMPPDLSWEAQDLISKMLKVNPNQRITVDDICKHPLLTKYPDPSSKSSGRPGMNMNNLNVKPIESVDKIDKEILKNLAVLFHNCSEEVIISKLLSPNKCPEKMFYFLLMKYRNEHTSRDSSYYEDDTELTASESKNTLPRSTSIVKTITVDSVTGEKHTTIKKIPNSTSQNSNRSNRQNKDDRILSNITNTASNSRNFKASNSFNKKKILLNNQVISRNSSSKSLKKISTAKTKKLSQSQSKIKRKPTGLDLYGMKEQGNNSSLVNQKQRSDNLGNKSLMNFELICQSSFNENNDANVAVEEKPKESSKYNELSTLARREKELTDKIKQLNEKREARIKKQESLRREELKKKQMKAESEKLKSPASLQQQQEQALKRLQSHKSNNDFAEILSSQRHVTEPPISSLDPKRSSKSLLRAKSLASNHTSDTKPSSNERKNRVLQTLGNAGIYSPSLASRFNDKTLSESMKTSSSKNLSSYLVSSNVDDTVIHHLVEDDDKENVTIQSFNEREKSSISLKPTINNPKRKSTEKMKYKSLLGEVKENEAAPSNDESSFDNTFESAQQSELIPNPRFSRFSFGGLLNTSKYENVGDITIMNNLGSSGTVLRKGNNDRVQGRSLKSASKSNLKKSSSNLLGLGIDLKSLRLQEEPNQTTFNPFGESEEFGSIDVTGFHSNNISRNIPVDQKEKIYIFEDDDEKNGNSFTDSSNNLDVKTAKFSSLARNESEYSNFEVISSRTAEVGMISSMRPSIVQSQNTSVDSIEPTDQRVKSIYEKYEKLYHKDNTSSRVDHPNLKPDNGRENSEDTLKIHSDASASTFKGNTNIEVFDSYSSDEKHADKTKHISSVKTKRVSQHSDSTVRWMGNASEDVQHVIKGEPVSSKSEDKDNIMEEKKNKEVDNIGNNVKPFEGDANKQQGPAEGEHSTNVFKRISLNPKRAAPKAPSINSNENKKSDLQNGNKKDNWFKKFFNSLTSTPKVGFKETMSKRDLHTITSKLSSQDIFGVIKYHLQLKQIEGSLTKVDMDEEFGMLSGVIPSNILHGGRRLKFKIEVTDMSNSSTLCLTKIKGTEKSFHNLINIVQYIVNQEEKREVEKNRTNSVAIYDFSGEKVHS